MTFEQFFWEALYVGAFVAGIYGAVAFWTAAVFYGRFCKIFYAKSEMEVSSGALWMDGKTVIQFSIVMGLVWPWTWYSYFSGLKKPPPFLPFVPHGLT